MKQLILLLVLILARPGVAQDPEIVDSLVNLYFPPPLIIDDQQWYQTWEGAGGWMTILKDTAGEYAGHRAQMWDSTHTQLLHFNNLQVSIPTEDFETYRRLRVDSVMFWLLDLYDRALLPRGIEEPPPPVTDTIPDPPEPTPLPTPLIHHEVVSTHIARGSGDDISIADNRNLTITFWARPIFTAGSYLVAKYTPSDGSPTGADYVIYNAEDSPGEGDVSFWISDGETTAQVRSETLLQANTWHFVAAQKIVDRLRLRVDDEVQETVFELDPRNSTGDLVFKAKTRTGFSAWAGDMVNVRVYNQTLTPDQISVIKTLDDPR